jgi:hypothetical protein
VAREEFSKARARQNANLLKYHKHGYGGMNKNSSVSLVNLNNKLSYYVAGLLDFRVLSLKRFCVTGETVTDCDDFLLTREDHS